jgi:hypothetical protein
VQGSSTEDDVLRAAGIDRAFSSRTPGRRWSWMPARP